MARSRLRSNFKGSRRQTEWLALASPSVLTVLPALSKIQFSTGLTADEIDKLPFTIVRTIGMLYVESDQVAGSEPTAGAMGITVVTARALTVGITALPDPITEAEADYWFLFQPWMASARITGGGDLENHVYRSMFDTKAMRKVEEGEQLAFIIANASASFGIHFMISLRMLIKLH